jgi:hypothetical protein
MWTINGCTIERKSEKSFVVIIEDEFKKKLNSFKEAFIFASSQEAQAIILQIKDKKEIKQKLAKKK